MAKKVVQAKRGASRAAASKKKTTAKKGPSAKKAPKAAPKSVKIPPEAVAREKSEVMPATRAAATPAAHPYRNSDFPRTYISQINVALDDPDHRMTFDWTGPQAGSQEAGPFRTSPGAGLKGLNCNNEATSRRSGSYCTPKGTHFVQGYQSRLNSNASATYVTWFVRRRGIAFHYFPSVPRYSASHGCIRVEKKRVAQMIQDNTRVGATKVVVSGTWTKPPRQY